MHYGQIGPYRIVKTLGEGGMGVVYLAEQTQPIRRQVALKVIKPGMDSKAVVARFEAERQALALMDHSCVAKVFDAGATERGHPFFVMEFVRGVAITEYCDRHCLSIEDRLELFVDVCEAVQHAHQKGIIHRDIKPSNILVEHVDGRAAVKVIDFGVAKAIDQRLTEKTIFTQLGQLVGTPAYMSPEQAALTSHDIDTRSDVYSLGVVLYQLLTSALPFDPESLYRSAFDEICRIIREDEPPKPSTKFSGLSGDDGAASAETARKRQTSMDALARRLRGDLDWVTMKALEKERARRYASPADLAADIRRHLRYEAVLASPPSTLYRLRKFVRRNRGLVAALVTILAVLVGGIVTSTSFALHASRQSELATIAKDEAEAHADAATSAKIEADRQASIAKAVNEFLNDDLLAQADPFREADRNATIRTLLDRASTKLKGRFEDQPTVEAAIRTTLGKTYRHLAEYQTSQRHLDRAVSLYVQNLGPRHPDALYAMHEKAAVYGDLEDYDQAEYLFKQTLQLMRETLGPDDPSTLQTLNDLAELYRHLGRAEEAEVLFIEAIDRQKRVLGEEHEQTLVSINNLALLYDNQGQQDKAEPLFVKVEQACRRTLGTKHPYTLSAMNNLANLHETRKRYDLAEPLYLEALEVRKEVLGPEHPKTLISMNNLAFLYLSQDRLDEAESLFKQTLDVRLRTLGEDASDTLISLLNMGGVYMKMNRHQDAEPLLKRAVEGGRRTLPEGHWFTGVFLGKHGECLKRLKQWTEAERALLEAYRILQAALGDEHTRTLGTVRHLAALYKVTGQQDKASEWHAKLPQDQAGQD